MPIADFQECMLYDQLEPLGDVRGDLQAGIIASTIANFSGRVKQTLSPDTFMPLLKDKDGLEVPKTDLQAAEELHAKFQAFKLNRELLELKKQLS